MGFGKPLIPCSPWMFISTSQYRLHLDGISMKYKGPSEKDICGAKTFLDKGGGREEGFKHSITFSCCYFFVP